jgi:hypothetical protein
MFDNEPTMLTDDAVRTMAVMHQEVLSMRYNDYLQVIEGSTPQELQEQLCFLLYVAPRAIPVALCTTDVVYGVYRYLRFIRDVYGIRITPTTVAEYYTVAVFMLDFVRIISQLVYPADALRIAIANRWKSPAVMLEAQHENRLYNRHTDVEIPVC